MAAYVDITYVSLSAVMLPEEIAEVETRYPGFFAATAIAVSRLFDSSLSKRYAAPFVDPVPEVLRANVRDVVENRVRVRHGGWPTTTEKGASIQAAADLAMTWLTNAANSKDGLVELPLREDTTASGISVGGPLSYSEQSPYVAFDDQVVIGRQEDFDGRSR